MGRELRGGRFGRTEIAFFARDDGNVWILGEYPEEYEDGVLEKAPAWIHGAEGSKAGTLMPANPRPDTPSFGSRRCLGPGGQRVRTERGVRNDRTDRGA